MYSIAFCHFNLVFLSPGDAVRPIALNSAWTERHCHACKMPRSMYNTSTTVSQLFEPQLQKWPFLRTPAFIFCLPWGRPCGNHAKRCMNEKTIQCLPNPSQHVPICLQQFPSYSNRKCKKSPFTQWMERQFNACQTPHSMYLSIFNRPSFRVI